jgi:hypothetical protein
MESGSWVNVKSIAIGMAIRQSEPSFPAGFAAWWSLCGSERGGMAKTKTRRAASSLRVNPNVRALRIYPVEGSIKTIEELNSVGIKLSREQAIHLARVLLAMTQEWDEVEITAYRLAARADGTFSVTVTSRIPPAIPAGR